MSHTPGPWHWDGLDCLSDCDGLLDSADDAVLCGSWRNDSTAGVWVHPANAHLIAAAPELLAALYHMRSCGECAEDDWQVCEGGRAALAAIAKATGEQP